MDRLSPRPPVIPRPVAPMTAAELLETIRALGFSQCEAARRLGLNPRTVRRYLAGEGRLDARGAQLLRLWLLESRLRPERG